ncbi:MAG: hypothetical protein H6918_12045 [Sphingomonadaceae bacterium]|jgi:hypothetical protein|nr:hypothetical protein [Sphingomonadaceae bacterium]
MVLKSIQDLKELLDELRAANARELDPITISRLRTQFNELMERLADEGATMPGFEDRFGEIKSLTGYHQLKWGTGRFLGDPEAYRDDSRKVGLEVREFIAWVEAGGNGREIGQEQ